jgi:hypothetical protein
LNRATGLAIRLDHASESCKPGGWIHGSVELTSTSKPVTGNLEVALIWRTVGKGMQDAHLGALQLVVPHRSVEPGQQYRFNLPAPSMPQTQAGKLVKVRWLVRARLTPDDGEPYFGLCSVTIG